MRVIPITSPHIFNLPKGPSAIVSVNGEKDPSQMMTLIYDYLETKCPITYNPEKKAAYSNTYNPKKSGRGRSFDSLAAEHRQAYLALHSSQVCILFCFCSDCSLRDYRDMLYHMNGIRILYKWQKLTIVVINSY
jgi:hypothetical protein